MTHVEQINNGAFAAILVAIKVNEQRLNILDQEEEEDLVIVSCVSALLSNLETSRERTVWRHPTSNHWWTDTYPTLPDELFIQHFRVDKPTFQWIVDQVRDEMTTQDNRFRYATEVEKKVAVSMKCLASTSDYLTVAALFGIGRSSAHRYFLQFIETMYQKVVPNAIKFPDEAGIRLCAQVFENTYGFPMAFAAIDGTHIPFNPPMGLASDFHNYKGWRSILAVAMCDANGRAIWINSGLPGRLSDSGAFKKTDCYKMLSTGQLLPNDTKVINGVKIPYILLGDSAFALEKWLMKPFTHHKALSDQQSRFNERHSLARRAVECMFGRVKMRWRRLYRGLDVNYEMAHKVISVAFALHNICETKRIILPILNEEQIENDQLEATFPQPAAESNAEEPSGVLCRNALMEYFTANPLFGN